MSQRRPSVDGLSPADAAAYWFARLKSGQASEADKAAFEAWLAAAPAHRAAFDEAEAAWDAAGDVASDPAIMRLREAALEVRPHGFRFTATRAAAAIAFAALLAVGAVVAGAPELRDQAIAWLAGSQGVAHGAFQTAIGERSTVTLEDGSLAILNTNSAAEVDYSASERRVRLIRGQALFEVAKNPRRPFVVFAGDRRITALGTAFDVRLEGARVEVTLVEGKVAVDAATSATPPGLAPATARAELEPGERLIAERGRPVSVKAANAERVTAWRGGKLVFQDDALADVVAEISRYSRTRIVIADESIGRLRVSGVFRTGQADNFANAITEFFPLAVEDRANGERVLVWKKNR